jgi:membrane-bound metal-dependent hydrolase YbcI (DUF457 family)
MPDIDLLVNFLNHRGPTHSLITILAFTIPLLILYRKTVIPYFTALASHTLIADFFTGPTELFWPISKQWYEALSLNINTLNYALLELIPFIISIALMLKNGDLQKIITDKHKIALIIPIGAILGPLLLTTSSFEYILPISLILPSLFYLTIFGYLIISSKFTKKENDSTLLKKSTIAC